MNKSNLHKVIFHSPHSIEECYKRLEESVETSFFPYFSSKKVVGRVSKKSISIRKKINYRNSFQTVLRASIEPSGKGTELLVSFGLHPFVKIFMLFWFGFLILIGGTIFIITLSSLFIKKSPIDIGTIMGILIPPGMAVFGIALLLFCKYLSSDESAFLKAFLSDLIDAEEMNDVEPVSSVDSQG